MKLRLWIRLARPQQWLKNLMLFFPPFLSGAMAHAWVWKRGALPFAAFCLASSAGYVLNDLSDRDRDAAHPHKVDRPLAAGAVAPGAAGGYCAFLAVLSVLLAQQVSTTFLIYLLVYLSVSAAYSLLLKDVPLLDIFCIALGFVLRLYGGGEAFRVEISDWLFLSVFLLAIFLSVGKRFSEQCQLGSKAGMHRRALEEYPEGFLESAMYLSGSAVVVTYAMYAIARPQMVFTVPLCMFGLLRYLLRVKGGASGDPTGALLRDIPLLVTSVLWVLLVGWSVYL
jgi:4-hydroxybenzoate polyprenyltransferase